MDVGWSPINPALFACIDTTGRLDIWNINQVYCMYMYVCMYMPCAFRCVLILLGQKRNLTR